MPNEVLKIITSYLTFKERLRVGWTNTRLRALPMIPEFWRLIKIRDTTLSFALITTVIEMCTKRLIIPGCSIQGNQLEVYGLENFMIEHAPELEHIGMAGYKGSDRLAATLIYMSKKLTVLDLAESRFALMSSIINKLPLSCNITAMDLSAIRDGAHQEWTDVLPYETVKLLVNKCRKLTDLILFGTKLCRKSITHLCGNLTNTILRLNIAQEDIRNDDIEALSKQYPNLQYLNIADTMVSYNAIADISIGWKHTMIQLCLPKQITLSLDRKTQPSGLVEQFRVMIATMSRLKFLHVGDFWGEMDNDLDNNHVAVLKNLFPKLKINPSSYNSNSTLKSDPYFVFRHTDNVRGLQ
jgi:hypothetical protein